MPDLPFEGGVTVPRPHGTLALLTLGDGSLPLGFELPPGLPHASIFVLQYWIEDPVGPAGCSSSNGL